MIQNAMDNVAYKAARESMLPGTTNASSIARGQTVLRLLGATRGTMALTPNPIVATSTDVTVDIAIPVADIS